MTIKLIEATETHADLSGILMKLFLKNPALTFVEEAYRYISRPNQEDSIKTAVEFIVYHGVDKVGTIKVKDGKIFVGSPRIKKAKSPRNEFYTSDKNAAIRKATEVFIPKDNADIVNEVFEKGKRIVEDVRYASYRLLPDLPTREVFLFFMNYMESDQRIPVPTFIQSKFTEKVKKAAADHEILCEMRDKFEKQSGYVLREEIDKSMTVVSVKDKSLFYRGSSTYDLPEWMQSKVTILKLLEHNQAARNIGCKGVVSDVTHYYIVDGDIPNLIE